ncbi:MAG: Aspartate--tRNA(Asp/Asn) ligase [Candidatus Woesearchaeota archaeon]|nr:Aspartate--tRNA(Asp/Asn) ligase [Candidatus Woesearchaeota archaeon]
MYRTKNCGELRKKHEGQEVKLAGWVHSIRIGGKFGFMDLRDRYGITQIFFKEKFTEQLKDIKRESVVSVSGKVKAKPKANPKLQTGEVELTAEELKILSPAEPLPMELDESIESTEETRLSYRYLDLRKPRMQKNLILRHKTAFAVREFLNKEGFIEIETPLLAKSTPEGARDYLVPSRVNKGKFYALPQSPQIFKQLLMIAGYDKYFQIVKCLRDEDLRADRQPEFTQIDIEMSFIEQDDILSMCERLVKHVFKKVLNIELEIPFQRMTYKEAMEKHNSDKPDLRKEGDKFKFLWVVDFPMFEYSEEDDRYKAMHHPFTMPNTIDFSEMDKVLSKGYDLVLNGWEVGGGSLRIFNTEMQEKVFSALGLSEEEAKSKFGFLMEAMKYGNPPLGGIAFGFDRLVALMAGETSIREVIAFPKNKDAEDLMTKAPSDVSKEQLDELGLKLK